MATEIHPLAHWLARWIERGQSEGVPQERSHTFDWFLSLLPPPPSPSPSSLTSARAVSGMLPKNKTRKEREGRLKIYSESEHPHEVLLSFFLSAFLLFSFSTLLPPSTPLISTSWLFLPLFLSCFSLTRHPGTATAILRPSSDKG